jgi:hypothetical protein
MAEFENNLISSAESDGKGAERAPIPFRTECAEDHVLPDYMGDVKRIMRAAARVIPISRIISDSEISVLASVSFSVLYLDSEDKLTEVTFAKDVEYNEKLSYEVSDADVSFNLPTASIRLSGPRKICARAYVSGEICVTDRGITPKNELPEGVESKKSTVYVHSAEYLCGDEREYAEELYVFNDVGSDEIETVAVFSTGVVTDVSLTHSRVEIGALARVKVILRVDGELTHVERDIKIEDTVDCACEFDGNAYPSASLTVTDCKIDLNERTDADGALSTSAVVTVSAKTCARIDYNKPTEIVNDAFMPQMKNECSYAPINYESVISSLSGRVEADFDADGGEGGLADLLYSECHPSSTVISDSDGYYYLKSDISYLAIAIDNLGVPKVIKGEYALECKTVIPVTRKNAKIRYSLSTENDSAAIDGDKISFSLRFRINLTELECNEESCLCSLKSTKCDGAGRLITVYYPDEGENTWQIAKKYSQRVSDIVANNPEAFDQDMNIITKRIVLFEG